MSGFSKITSTGNAGKGAARDTRRFRHEMFVVRPGHPAREMLPDGTAHACDSNDGRTGGRYGGTVVWFCSQCSRYMSEEPRTTAHRLN